MVVMDLLTAECRVVTTVVTNVRETGGVDVDGRCGQTRSGVGHECGPAKGSASKRKQSYNTSWNAREFLYNGLSALKSLFKQ